MASTLLKVYPFFFFLACLDILAWPPRRHWTPTSQSSSSPSPPPRTQSGTITLAERCRGCCSLLPSSGWSKLQKCPEIFWVCHPWDEIRFWPTLLRCLKSCPQRFGSMKVLSKPHTLSQSWALSVFFIFSTKKMIFLHFLAS